MAAQHPGRSGPRTHDRGNPVPCCHGRAHLRALVPAHRFRPGEPAPRANPELNTRPDTVRSLEPDLERTRHRVHVTDRVSRIRPGHCARIRPAHVAADSHADGKANSEAHAHGNGQANGHGDTHADAHTHSHAHDDPAHLHRALLTAVEAALI
jgi:hypothetical protein